MEPQVIIALLAESESDPFASMPLDGWKIDQPEEKSWRARRQFDTIGECNNYQFDLADLISKRPKEAEFNVQIEFYIDEDFSIDSFYFGPYLTGALSEGGIVMRLMICDSKDI